MIMNQKIGRRKILQGVAAAVGVGIAGPVFSAPRPVKIGIVVPLTGHLALFAESTRFAIDQVKRSVGSEITINGTKHPLEIIVKDSQSNPNRASEVALELILRDKIDLMLASATPETTNPVSDQCELNGVPCITTVAPVEAWFNGRQGAKTNGFEWTYHFFVSVAESVSSFMNVWKRLDTNKRAGILLPNTTDGNVYAPLAPVVAKASGLGDWQLIDPGRFDTPANNFSSQIQALKKAEADVCWIVSSPPDFTVFLNQAAQAGYRPRVLVPTKVAEFPAFITPMGKRAQNFTTPIWWHRDHPFASGLTKQSAAEVADEFEKVTGKQASMALGFDHALFELAFDTLRRTQDINKRSSIRDALKATQYDSVVGPINFNKGKLANTAVTPVATGQWREGKKWPMELVVVDNSIAPSIPVQGAPETLW